MNVITGVKSKLTLASIAMLASMGAQAVPLSDPSISGLSTTYLETVPGSGVLAASPGNSANWAAALSGAGNVELGKYGNVTSSAPLGTATTLSGNFGGTSVTLSSLTKSDWTANGNSLASAYISGAANFYGLSVDLNAAVDAFLKPLTSGPGAGLSPWQFVSDPNISDVNLNGGHVAVGLDGFLNGSTILNALFGPGVTAPKGSTASEVVRVDYQGNTKYLYGFSATATGYHTLDGSYNGRFNIPEPSTLALLALGFGGLSFMRRHSIS